MLLEACEEALACAATREACASRDAALKETAEAEKKAKAAAAEYDLAPVRAECERLRGQLTTVEARALSAERLAGRCVDAWDCPCLHLRFDGASTGVV